jgi:hypothetical protein
VGRLPTPNPVCDSLTRERQRVVDRAGVGGAPLGFYPVAVLACQGVPPTPRRHQLADRYEDEDVLPEAFVGAPLSPDRGVNVSC